MRFRDIAFSSLRRRRGRSLFLILSLSVATGMIVVVISVTAAMKARVDSKLREFGANMVVIPKGLEMPVAFGGLTIGAVSARVGELTEEDVIRVASIQRKDTLRVVSPKLLGATQIEGKEFIVVGVRFRDELKMKPWWKISGRKPSLSRDLLIGAVTSRQLERKAGDVLMLGGKEFRVAGILDEQFSAEDPAIFADLREAGLLFDKPGRVSLIELSTWCVDCPIDTVVEQISAKLPNAKVVAIKQLVEAELSQVSLMVKFAVMLAAIILVAGSLIMLLAMMGAIKERTHEIGILRAIGFRRSHITRLILLEGLTLSLIGGCLGAMVGSMAGIWLSGILVGPEEPLSFSPWFAGIAFLLAVAMGTLPTIYLGQKASRIDPVSALRAIG